MWWVVGLVLGGVAHAEPETYRERCRAAPLDPEQPALLARIVVGEPEGRQCAPGRRRRALRMLIDETPIDAPRFDTIMVSLRSRRGPDRSLARRIVEAGWTGETLRDGAVTRLWSRMLPGAEGEEPVHHPQFRRWVGPVLPIRHYEINLIAAAGSPEERARLLELPPEQVATWCLPGADAQETRRLLALGADVELRARPLLGAALRDNQVGIAQVLLDAGAPVDGVLSDVLATASVDAVRWLLDHGADPEEVGANGSTAIRQAIRLQRPEVFEVLLDRLPEANLVPLLRSAMRGNDPRFAQILLARGASAQSVLSHAPSMQWVEFLTLEGAQLDSPEGALLLARHASCGRDDLVRWLVERGADPAGRTEQGLSVIEAAQIRSFAKCRATPGRLRTLQTLAAAAEKASP